MRTCHSVEPFRHCLTNSARCYARFWRCECKFTFNGALKITKYEQRGIARLFVALVTIAFGVPDDLLLGQKAIIIRIIQGKRVLCEVSSVLLMAN